MNTARDTIADLIADVRFSQRKIDAGMKEVAEEIDYRDKCLQQIRAIFVCRHNFKTNRYGWPDVLGDTLPDHKEY